MAYRLASMLTGTNSTQIVVGEVTSIIDESLKDPNWRKNPNNKTCFLTHMHGQGLKVIAAKRDAMIEASKSEFVV